jgi:prolyl 4-hydroxylase
MESIGISLVRVLTMIVRILPVRSSTQNAKGQTLPTHFKSAKHYYLFLTKYSNMLVQFFSSSLLVLACLVVQSQCAEEDYGVDCSWPITSTNFRCGDRLGDRKKVYEDFMNGCREHYGKKGDRCDTVEQDRLEMSLRQPQSMVNYTSTGYKKIKAPKEVMELLIKHWERNKDKKKPEQWFLGNTYVNHWTAPTSMVVRIYL